MIDLGTDVDWQLPTKTSESDVKGHKRLTAQQQKYVNAVVSGHSPSDGARLAGYAAPKEAGWHNCRNPAIATEVRLGLMRRLFTDGARVGLNVLLEIAENKKAPSGARVQAANSLLDRAGMASKLLNNQQDSKPKAIDDMSLDELDAFISAGKQAIESARDKQAIEGNAAHNAAQQPSLIVIDQQPALPE